MAFTPKQSQSTAKSRQVKPSAKVTWLHRVSFTGSWLLVCVALMMCGAGSWALIQTIFHAPVAQVQITGSVNTFEQQYMLQHLQPLVTKGYFSSNLVRLRDEALKSTWVDTVSVTRHWPAGIVVRITPRQGVARWGGARLLSRQGVIFAESQYHPHLELTIMHGPATQSKALMNLYYTVNQWFMPLGLRLKEIYFTDRLTCFMQFENGLRIIVDKDNTMVKLQQFAQLASGQLKPFVPYLAQIDLRYRNGLAVQWKSGHKPAVVSGGLALH